MIRSFAHRGLKRLYERGDASGIRPDLLDKVRTILAQLDDAQIIDDMRAPGFRLHALKGEEGLLVGERQNQLTHHLQVRRRRRLGC